MIQNYYYYLIIFLLQEFIVIRINANDTKIFHGYTCSTKDHPFLVRIVGEALDREGNRTGNLSAGCGGSLIKPQWVLTAAHCLLKRRRNIYSVMYAIHVEKKLAQEADYFLYPDYVERNITIGHDIALLQINRSLTKNDHIDFINLPKQVMNGDPPCKTGLIMGFGRTHEVTQIPPLDRNLKCAKIPVISYKECKYMLAKYRNNTLVDPNLVCTYSKESKAVCSGDSGGPLLCDSIIVGVVSWSFGCGKRNSPSMFARVDRYLKWIDHTIYIHNRDDDNEEEGKEQDGSYVFYSGVSFKNLVIFHVFSSLYNILDFNVI